MISRIRLFFYMLVCCLGLTSAAAFAAEVPDAGQMGSITVTVHTEEGAVSGGSLLFYKAADVAEQDGNLFFVLTEEFAESGCSLEDLETEKVSDGSLAAELAAWAAEKELEGSVAEVDSQGKAVQQDLTIGLYLVVQNVAAEGYEKINPFLVTIPCRDGDGLVYDVDASPKCSTVTETKPVTPPPERPPHLPQTGQLWWPVPILAVLGLMFFAVGWKRRSNS